MNWRDLLSVHHRQRSVADGTKSAAVARVHFAHAGAFVQQTIFIGGGTKHTHHYFGNIGCSGGFHGVHQIEGRIGTGTVARALRTHQHHRNRQVLTHKRERCTGMVQGVGAMSDYNAVNARFNFFSNGFRQRDILFWTHVFAKNSKKFLGFQVADVGQFGHSTIQLTW